MQGSFSAKIQIPITSIYHGSALSCSLHNVVVYLLSFCDGIMHHQIFKCHN